MCQRSLETITCIWWSEPYFSLSGSSMFSCATHVPYISFKKKKKLSMFPSATLCHSKYLYVSMFSSTTTRVLSPSFPRSSIGPSRMSMPNGRLLFHCLVGSWKRVLSAAPQRIWGSKMSLLLLRLHCMKANVLHFRP